MHVCFRRPASNTRIHSRRRPQKMRLVTQMQSSTGPCAPLGPHSGLGKQTGAGGLPPDTPNFAAALLACGAHRVSGSQESAWLGTQSADPRVIGKGPLGAAERDTSSGPADWALPDIWLLLDLWASERLSDKGAWILLGFPEVGVHLRRTRGRPLLGGVRLAHFSCLRLSLADRVQVPGSGLG